jgi:FtsZ-binding cell division protein ZapB
MIKVTSEINDALVAGIDCQCELYDLKYKYQQLEEENQRLREALQNIVADADKVQDWYEVSGIYIERAVEILRRVSND